MVGGFIRDHSLGVVDTVVAVRGHAARQPPRASLAPRVKLRVSHPYFLAALASSGTVKLRLGLHTALPSWGTSEFAQCLDCEPEGRLVGRRSGLAGLIILTLD